MDLWIRSQDKEILVKANALYVMENQIWNEVPFYENHKKIGLTITGHNHRLAQYKSKERALEILNEIQNKIKTLLYLKPTCILETNKIEAAKHYYEDLNDKEFITCDNNFEIIPFSTNVIVYEMPEE